MALSFSTLAEFDAEIEIFRGYIRNAAKAREFSLNTGQSTQRVVMDVKEIRLYLNQLVAERQAFIEHDAGGGVTAITVRRF